MSGKAARRKGHDFERWAARQLRVSFPDARRGLQYRDPRECDVECTPLRWELKRQKRFQYAEIINAIMQCKRDGEEFQDDRLPIVLTKADNREPLVHTTLDVFLQLVEKHFYKPTEEGELLFFPLQEDD